MSHRKLVYKHSGPMLCILLFLLIFLGLTHHKMRKHVSRMESLSSHGIANTDATTEIVEVYRLIVIALVLWFEVMTT